MKLMKKSVVVMLLIVFSLSMTGCAKAPDVCESCRQERKLTKIEVAGETAWLCSTCKGLVEMLGVMP